MIQQQETVEPPAEAVETVAPLITNHAVIFGILMMILGFVFWSASRDTGFWKKFYTFVPSLLLCYFIPSLLGTWNIVDAQDRTLYYVARDYLLPTSLVLLTLSIDLKAILGLGPKALIMFATGTIGIVIGGPLAIMIVSAVDPVPVTGTPPDDVWRGLTTVAGSWIGGGANQAAMKEIYDVSDGFFGAFVAVDVIVANVWMAVILFAAGRAAAIDRRTGADASAIADLRDRVSHYHAQIMRIPKLPDSMVVLAVGFGVTAISHAGADAISAGLLSVAGGDADHFLNETSLTKSFFWLMVLSTTGGVLLSFTRARQLEGVGASRMGSIFLYVLVATIGLGMDLSAIKEHWELFVVGLIWIAIHAALLIGVALLIKAPVFFLAVGSQANVGGAASAPIVASAFHPSLASVGVLLAVLGYALGTYAAIICAELMKAVAPVAGM